MNRRIRLLAIFALVAVLGVLAIVFLRGDKRVIVVVLSEVGKDELVPVLARQLSALSELQQGFSMAIVGDTIVRYTADAGNRLRPEPLTSDRIGSELSSLLPAQLGAAPQRDIERALAQKAAVVVVIAPDSISRPAAVPHRLHTKFVMCIGSESQYIAQLKSLARTSGAEFRFVPVAFASIAQAEKQQSVSAPQSEPVAQPKQETGVLDIYVVSRPSSRIHRALESRLHELLSAYSEVRIHRTDGTFVYDSVGWSVIHRMLMDVPMAEPSDYRRIFSSLAVHCSTDRAVRVVIVGNMNNIGRSVEDGTYGQFLNLDCLRRRPKLMMTIATEPGTGHQVWHAAAMKLEVPYDVVP
ncbi:MAG: hypothetical protein N3B17_00760 [Chlorobi bacterium]|nr:hypothetical protein [Chlorobiota bacterium]